MPRQAVVIPWEHNCRCLVAVVGFTAALVEAQGWVLLPQWQGWTAMGISPTLV